MKQFQNLNVVIPETFFKSFRMTRIFWITNILICFIIVKATSQQLAGEGDGGGEALSFETRFVEGFIAFQQDKWDEAIKIYENLLIEDRRSDAVAFELARTWRKKDQITKAYEYIERAVRLVPENIWYQLFKAKLLEEDARYTEAADQYDLLIKLDPGAFEFYKQKATNLARSGRYKDAAEALEPYEQQFGTSEDILQRKYDMFMAANMPEEAAEELRNMLEIQPGNTHFLYLLATHLSKKGETAEADSLLSRILQIDPSDARAGIALSKKNKGQNMAIPYLQSLRKIFSDPAADLDAKILELIPFIENLNPGDTLLIETLIENIKILNQAHPNQAKVYTISGDLNKLRLHYQSAMLDYRQAVKLDKSNFAVFDELMYILYQLGDFQGLQKTAEEALDYYPNQIKAFLWQALSQIYQGKASQALRELDQTMLMSGGSKPLEARILAYKAFAYLHLNQTENAWSSYREMNTKAPEHEELHAFCLFHFSNQKTLREPIPQAIKNLSPQLQNSRIIHAVKLRFDAIQKTTGFDLNQIINLIPEAQDPLEMESYADIMMISGNTEQAEKLWRRAIALGGPAYRLHQKINKANIYAH